MTVRMHPKVPLTPRLLLHQMLEKVDDIEELVVLLINKRGMVDLHMTPVELRDLAFIKCNFDGLMQDIIREGAEAEDESEPRKG